MRTTLLKFTCVAAFLAWSTTVQAQTGLVIDPATLTDTGLTGDDVSLLRTLPTTGTFNFFGAHKPRSISLPMATLTSLEIPAFLTPHFPPASPVSLRFGTTSLPQSPLRPRSSWITRAM